MRWWMAVAAISNALGDLGVLVAEELDAEEAGPAARSPATPRRSSQVTVVPGSLARCGASSMTAVAEEWPAPRTTVCRPANGSGTAKSGIW